MKKIIIITGPTSVGKTKLSLALATYLNTDIINGDATQVFKGMDIGTAKATKAERFQVRHHFMDFLSPLDNFSIYEYQQGVRSLIEELSDNGKIPLLVGGSGLYLDSIVYDYQLTGPSRDYEFERKYEHLSNEELYLELIKLNQALAASIHPNNRKRVLRAIARMHNNAPYDYSARSKPLYDALYIFLTDEREVLYQAINERLDQMFDEGLLDEVESFYPDQISTQALGAIGYKELFRYFNNEWTLDMAKDKIKQVTRNYAKRQWTWFNNRPDITIVPINRSDFNQTIEEVKQIANNFLSQ